MLGVGDFPDQPFIQFTNKNKGPYRPHLGNIYDNLCDLIMKYQDPQKIVEKQKAYLSMRNLDYDSGSKFPLDIIDMRKPEEFEEEDKQKAQEEEIRKIQKIKQLNKIKW